MYIPCLQNTCKPLLVVFLFCMWQASPLLEYFILSVTFFYYGRVEICHRQNKKTIKRGLLVVQANVLPQVQISWRKSMGIFQSLFQVSDSLWTKGLRWHRENNNFLKDHIFCLAIIIVIYKGIYRSMMKILQSADENPAVYLQNITLTHVYRWSSNEKPSIIWISTDFGDKSSGPEKTYFYYNACRNWQNTPLQHKRHDNKLSIGAYNSLKSATGREMTYVVGSASRTLWKPLDWVRPGRMATSTIHFATLVPKQRNGKCQHNPMYVFELQKYGGGKFVQNITHCFPPHVFQ